MEHKSKIDLLPEHLFEYAEPPKTKHIRSVFVRHESTKIWSPDDFDVVLQPGERIISVETIQPNPAIGPGTRVWIECV